MSKKFIVVIKVLIVDDYVIVCEGLCQICVGSKDIVVVGNVVNGLEVIKLVCEGNGDVMLFDIVLFDCSGIDIFKQICKEQLDLLVLILFIYCED